MSLGCKSDEQFICKSGDLLLTRRRQSLRRAWSYNYANNPFQISTLGDNSYRTEGEETANDVIKRSHACEYDLNGNLLYVNTSREKQDGQSEDKANEKKMVWDEENRLKSIYVNGFISGYWYDASGERVIKTGGDDEGIFVNDVFSGARTETTNFTAYINPYLVVSRGGSYTKHIYIGSQRIVSKLGDLDSYGSDPRRIEYAGANVDGASVDYNAKYKASQQQIKDNYVVFKVPYYGTDNNDYVNGAGFCCNDSPNKSSAFRSGMANDNPELFQYYYHSDHLGSTSLITDLDGNVVQHVEYVPYGEVFIEERNNIWNTPYLFNAKELDEETGLYYYGARYYDPRVSNWLSADPLQEKYPGISTYCYTVANPVRLIDPDGKDIIVLSAHNHVGGLGHAAVLIGNDEKGWNLYSKNGTLGISGGSLRLIGPEDHDNDDNGVHFNSLTEFANSLSNFDTKEYGDVTYTSAYRITSDKDEDMKQAASESVSSYYIFIGQSCIDVCSDALSAGGLNPGEKWFDRRSVIPNIRYEQIKNYNKGDDVTKSITPTNEMKEIMKTNSKKAQETKERSEQTQIIMDFNWSNLNW